MLIHVLSFSVVLILQASSIKDAKPFLFKSVSKHSLAVSHFLVVSLLWSVLGLPVYLPHCFLHVFPRCGARRSWAPRHGLPRVPPLCLPTAIWEMGNDTDDKILIVCAGCKIIYHIYVCVHAHLADLKKKNMIANKAFFGIYSWPSKSLNIYFLVFYFFMCVRSVNIFMPTQWHEFNVHFNHS